MIGVIPKVVPENILDETQELYRDCSNRVVVNTDEMDRHWPSMIGHFMISEFTAEEFADVWSVVKPALESHTGLGVDYVYGRVLKYAQGCYIPKHVDTFDTNSQKQSNLSVLIGLNAVDEYAGGILGVEGQQYILEPGDLLYYTYEHEHEVTPVRKGVRKVINMRCNLVK